jgi:fructokinase
MVSLAADGDRDFLFYGDRPAHLDLRLTAGMRALVRRAGVLHFGSISLIAEPARAATLAAVAEARRAGVLCSYDPNLRLNLWPSVGVARRTIRATLPLADVVKVNAEELAFLTGARGVSAGLQALCAAGPALAVATLGAEGCAYRTAGCEGKVDGFRARVVDTTGAGDAFVAALLAGLVAASGARPLALPGRAALEAILETANAAAALSTERRGGIPSLPSRRRVLAFLGRKR